MAADTPFSDSTTTTGQLKRLVQQFVDEREWGKYHNSKDVALAINVEAGELLEVFEWVREHELLALEQDAEKRRHIGEEMADIIILCLNLANVLGFDVAETVGLKLEKNRRKYPADQVRGNYRKYTELRAQGKAPDDSSSAHSA
ncbi:MAG: nucleotide pyrophosphohydrolase [Dehalococcoidia bacterium]|jgi:NTP pyrophosphatase (non-canonical NTP hydrolase)|nr:nucleotide pyrophosphohydrolase [Dehalococcoidia bacterium]